MKQNNLVLKWFEIFFSLEQKKNNNLDT